MSEKLEHTVDFDFQLISDFFKLIDRQGPGNREITLQALSFINNLPDKPRIADLGCGTGGQTITLAESTDGHITALDLLPDFVELLNQEIARLNYSDRMEAITGSMDNLPFREEEFDLIWAEGSIFGIGFERGLKEWRKYLKDGAFIAVSEASWFTEERPAEIKEFWDENYPEIDTIPNKIRIMQEAGYMPTVHFMLPESCWLDDFYAPMDAAADVFLKYHNYSDVAKQFVDALLHERDLYKKYKKYYGYIFYIGQKS